MEASELTLTLKFIVSGERIRSAIIIDGVDRYYVEEEDAKELMDLFNDLRRRD